MVELQWSVGKLGVVLFEVGWSASVGLGGVLMCDEGANWWSFCVGGADWIAGMYAGRR